MAPVCRGRTLAASGALLVTGYRRAGLIAAASGVALAMLDERDGRTWWKSSRLS